MAYCTWQDVQKKFQMVTFSVTSKPSTDQVTTWCQEKSQEMDLRLKGAGVTLPITDANKLLYLSNIAINGVKSEIYASINKIEESNAFNKKYNDELKRIENKPSILNAETTVSQAPGYKENNDKRIFESGKKQW